ncbi:MAG: hypothetical protein ACYTBZ_28655 [Planctomycetota bacterium]|jgi:hypothetical protein
MMKEFEVDKPILVLRGLLVLQVLGLIIYAIIKVLPAQGPVSGLMITFIILFLVVLYGVWKFKYWGWILAVVLIIGGSIRVLMRILGTSLSRSIVEGDYSVTANFQQLFQKEPITAAYYLLAFIINIVISILLVTERDYFSE